MWFVLLIRCAWAVRPTQYVEVKQKLCWNGNVVNADGHSQGLFPIEIPPDKYGDTQWESGGIVGVGTTSHSIHGTKKLEGEFKTGRNALGAGNRKLSCVLDSFEYNIDLEKTRANNRREITVTVLDSREDIEVPSSKQAGGNDMVNPALNPQPEVPSARQVGGNDMVNPSLNPQPEVPSPRRDDTANTVDPESELLPVLVVPKPIEN